MPAVLIPFGLRDGQLIHISEADRGLDCDCLCPECGQKLLAKKGIVKQHHFAHASKTQSLTCQGGVETALHQYAKQLIADAGYLMLPSLEIRLPFPNHHLRHTEVERKAIFDKVALEQTQLNGRRRVDVVGYVGSRRLLIEIFVTHRVRSKKLSDVKAGPDSMIEIEIPRDALFLKDNSGDNSLRDMILDRVNNKRWLFYSKAHNILEKLKNEAQKRREAHDASILSSHSLANASELPALSSTEANQTLNQEIKPIERFSRHMPNRNALTADAYVRELHAFLFGPNYTDVVRERVVCALKAGGDITANDIAVAAKLNLRFY